MHTTTISPIEALQESLGYTFRDVTLLERALTHKSRGPSNNERLEFLGDSVLGVIAALFLYERFAGLSEGDMSRVRAKLVCEEALADLGSRLKVDANMRVTEYGACPAVRPSTVADAMEAIFAAIFLDGGFDVAKSVVNAQLNYLLENSRVRLQKDPKTQLQEYLQQNGYQKPEYQLLQTAGRGFEIQFKVQCLVPELKVATNGAGRTRKDAEMQAADAALPLCRNRR